MADRKERITYDEWQERGLKLFGNDKLFWKFQCPMCNNVATPSDFIGKGGRADDATCNCIGRYMPKEERGGLSADHSNQKIKSPCDYAAHGLFKFAPLTVIFPDGVEVECFGFYQEGSDDESVSAQ